MLNPVFHWKLQKKVNKQHEIYMANAGPSRWGPNATYIPLARVGVLRWG